MDGAGAGGEGAVEVQRVERCRGRSGEETSPTSVHAWNLRRREEARNGNKKQSWSGE